jgi:hypothetical protein
VEEVEKQMEEEVEQVVIGHLFQAEQKLFYQVEHLTQ